MANTDSVTPDDPSQQGAELDDGKLPAIMDEETVSHNERKQRRQQKAPCKMCAVCGDKAMGYNFDAITCESCKAFFRRNALKDQDYHRCSFYNQCEINPISRRFCQKCRLLKCFKVGMKKEWIENEDKLMQRKRKRIDKNRRKSSCPDSSIQQPLRLLRNSSLTVSSGMCSDSNNGTRCSSESNCGSLSGCQIMPVKRKLSPLPIGCSKILRKDETFDFTSGSTLLRRDTVIRLGSASAPSSAACAPPNSNFQWPPNEQIGDYFRMVSIPAWLLTQLINSCRLSCLQAQIPVPPAVDFASAVLWRQSDSTVQPANVHR